MPDAPPSAWSLVKVPAVITLFVTALRVVGEIQGWSNTFFSSAAPGEIGPDGKPAPPGVIGITWLVAVFGFWFGHRLHRGTSEPYHFPKAFGLSLLAIVVVVGGAAALEAAGMITVPDDPAKPEEPTGIAFIVTLLGIGAIIAFLAWQRAALVLLLYGLLARIPVVIVTWLDLQQEWGTHYGKLPAGVPRREGTELFVYLAAPQLTIWIPFTIIVGGFCSCLGAAIAARMSPR